VRRLVELRASRVGRGERIVAHLQANGIAISLDAVSRHAAAARSAGRTSRAHWSTSARSGRRRGVHALAAPWSAAYEPNAELSARDAIELVHAAGGVAVLAHPPLSGGIDSPGGLVAFVERLVPLGLDGLEVWHPSHKPTAMRRLRRIAAAHDLLETGGSDFHGADRPRSKSAGARGQVAHRPRRARRARAEVARAARRTRFDPPRYREYLGRPV